MEKEKYYTPDVSEFHVGFEFEEKLLNGEWRAAVCEIYPSDQRGLVAVLPDEGDTVRVKYLDGDDLKELGWIDKGHLKFEHDNGGFGEWLSLHETDPEIVHLGNFTYKIKNKSELSRLMKQLQLTSA
jgi:hypothetical protein